MPRYSVLREALPGNLPAGWAVIFSDRGGVYLWPTDSEMRRYPTRVPILRDHAALFEVHVSNAGNVRILLRLRWGGEFTQRFELMDFKAAGLGCPQPIGGMPRWTKSVAMWPVDPQGAFESFAKGGDDVDGLAHAVSQFLSNPPTDFSKMRRFVRVYFNDSGNW